MDEKPGDEAPAATPPSPPPPDDSEQPDASTPAGEPPAKKRRWVMRHKALTAVAVVLVLVAGCSGGYLWWADRQLSSIPRIDIHIHTPPEKNHHESNKDLNILLLGADHGAVGQSVAEDLADGKWTPFKHLSDTIIVLHIPADRKSVQMVSIPRDTWVHIDGYPYGNHHAKINAAFSYGGPELAYKTVQQFTGLTIDHVAVIDWVGFRELTEALGGVRIYIPETFTDYKQDVTWEKGWHTLEGSDALKYVRTRHGLANGDFDRMARQQNFLRAIMAKMLSSSTTHNPLRFSKVLASLSSYLTIDSTWDNDELRSLAWSLRNLHAGDVDFFTAPFGSYATIDGQSVVRLDMPQFRFLMRSIDDDHVEKYVARYPGNHLASQTNIN